MLNHKKFFIFSVLASSIALAACQPQKAEPQEPEQQAASKVQDLSTKLIGDSEALNLNMPNCKGNSCPEITVERLSSNQSFIDQFIDEQVLKQLSQILSVEPEKDKAQTAASEADAASQAQSELAQVQTPKMKLEKQAMPYTLAFEKLDTELKALNSAQKISLMIKPKILNSEKPLATVVLNSSSYLGGAHGSSAQQYFNFDLQAKKLVKLEDIMEPKQKTVLEKKAHEAFKVWVNDSKLADNIQDYEQIWKFKLSDNYYLGKDGLILQYGEYEIGPYVVGLPRLTLPYTELKGILKPEYFPPAPVQPASEPQTKS